MCLVYLLRAGYNSPKMDHVVGIQKNKVGRKVVERGHDNIPHVIFLPVFNHCS